MPTRPTHLNLVNGQALRAIRERSRLSVRDVVAELNKKQFKVHENHLHNVEAGTRGGSVKLATVLAEVLGVPTTAILGTIPAPDSDEAFVGDGDEDASASAA